MKSFAEIKSMKKKDLNALIKKLGIKGVTKKTPEELIEETLFKLAKKDDVPMAKGVLEILPDGYGFLRSKTFTQSKEDVYVSPVQIRRFNLQTGDEVVGQVRVPDDPDKYRALTKIESINYLSTVEAKKRVIFDKLIPIFPDEMIPLERKDGDLSTRIIDIITPIGKGQRGTIVAPPKAGKTTLLKSIANSISENFPECTLIILLIDERPEEVTDIRRSTKAEVVASTFDEPITKHIQVSEIVLERAKRLVEQGKDVVVLLDSITRLARAYNLAIPPTGQTLSGGVNPSALYKPKRFFGAARNIENGGSLTILATALVDTGSKMDDVIFEEFKGTGNLELVLDRKLFDRRIFPAIDIKKSSTRKEELLFDPQVLKRIWMLRKVLDPLSPGEAMELLKKRIKETGDNLEFLLSIKAD
ncbi:MAG: transcription termination factor Rho [Candidatus Muiribacterium halophilum]|uniref:Transcription termination factor Rho n=1 Tax=Muiribacterium halophilum TaxID=2053465 RepID=A0A2N5ZK62_MUIH1|nr:MAG: transcription termination factor Rho [Candidatus Muirbacterium halophilum]